MAEEPGELTLRFSELASARLAEIWRWNANKYGAAHATQNLDFLKRKTCTLQTQYAKGRLVPNRD